MAHTFSLVLPTQDKHGSAASAPVFTGGAAHVPLAADQIALYTDLQTSQTHQQLDIITAWKMLYNGIRDRSLIPGQFKGFDIYSAVDVGNATENNRKTTSTDFVIQSGRVGIGISAGVTTAYLLGRGAVDATNILQSFFERLIQFALESPPFKTDGRSNAHWNPSIPATATMLDLGTPGLGATGNTGELTMLPNRSDAFTVDRVTFRLENATLEKAHETVYKQIQSRWMPYYESFFDGEACHINPHAEAAGHTDFDAGWTPDP